MEGKAVEGIESRGRVPYTLGASGPAPVRPRTPSDATDWYNASRVPPTDGKGVSSVVNSEECRIGSCDLQGSTFQRVRNEQEEKAGDGQRLTKRHNVRTRTGSHTANRSVYISPIRPGDHLRNGAVPARSRLGAGLISRAIPCVRV